MRSLASRVGVVVLLMVSPLALSSTVAVAADTTLGELSVLNATCNSTTGQTLLEGDSSSPSYTVPTPGVITSVQLGGDPNNAVSRGFRLGEYAGGGNWKIVAATGTSVLAAGQVLTQSVRIPARPQDVLGVYVAPEVTNYCKRNAGDAGAESVIDFVGNPGVGTSTMGTVENGYRVSVKATLEPDADGDGYGDTTQDLCPSQAGTHGLCDLPAIRATGAPRGKAKVGKKLTAPALSGVPTGAAETFQWYRIVKVKKHGRTVTRAIAGAHGSSYKLKKKDRGTRVFVKMTVTKPGFVPTAVSSPSKRVR